MRTLKSNSPGISINSSPRWTLRIDVSTPLWFYCEQVTHCGSVSFFSFSLSLWNFTPFLCRRYLDTCHDGDFFFQGYGGCHQPFNEWKQDLRRLPQACRNARRFCFCFGKRVSECFRICRCRSRFSCPRRSSEPTTDTFWKLDFLFTPIRSSTNGRSVQRHQHVLIPFWIRKCLVSR